VFKVRRRVVVTAAAVLVVLLAVGVAVTFTGGDSQASDRKYIDGSTSAWLYTAGHRPPAPDFTGTTLTGAPIKFSSYKGKVVVLNFWASWCPPCRAEAPTLAVLSEKYARDGVSFLGDDVNDTPTNGLSFTRSIGITYPSVNDPSYQVVQDFGNAVLINDTPTTLVIDRTGHIAGVVYGAVTYSELDTMIHDVVSQ
jgi:thiol-disulfide isomerase/thioredoxin